MTHSFNAARGTANNGNEEPMQYVINEVDSLGFGEGSLGYKPERYPDGVLKDAIDLIKSGECMVEVTDPDDGCMDGRHATKVIFMEGDEFVTRPIEETGRQHDRSKVTGGGAIVGMMSFLSQGGGSIARDPERPLTPEQLLTNVVIALGAEEVFVGAHTASANGDDATGCAANDAVDTVMRNGNEWRDNIIPMAIASLKRQGESPDLEMINTVLENWQSLLNRGFFDGSTGASRLKAIQDGIREFRKDNPSDKPRAVIKYLNSKHFEAFELRNFVPGKTFSQKKFRELLHTKYPDIDPDQLPQVFATDAWRVEQIAKALSLSDEDY
ncbi:MAG: hypothetical protein ACM3JF_02210, partial [Sphaerimonospora mesophila]